MKLATILGLASVTSAHTLFTTLYINGKNQGDGTCVRMPKDGATGTAPIYPITGDAMACGYGGQTPVDYVCPASSGARLTFEFRLWPDAQKPGSIDPGHKGPCAVYVKRLDDMFADAAAGPGWFKIWEDGFDTDTQEWCTDRLVRHDGLLSVDLPTGLAPGYYLVRPEILALHFAAHRGDPQFYTGCAQIFVQGAGGPEVAEAVPREYSVAIPGYVAKGEPGLVFDIYQDHMPAYPMPGPRVYVVTAPSSSPSSKESKKLELAVLGKGAVPSSCLIRNANWCAEPVARYKDMEGCWAGVEACYDQSKLCWDSAPASGATNCETWSSYCSDMNDACEREEFEGPPPFTGTQKYSTNPDEIPAPWGKKFKETDVDVSGDEATGSLQSTVPNSSSVGHDASSKTVESSESASGITTATSHKTMATLSSIPNKTAPGSETTTVSSTASITTHISPEYTAFCSANRDNGGNDKNCNTLPLQVSTHGRCGPEFGQTCSGSGFGDCCSRSGECGRKARHCSCGCLSGFGTCW